MLVVFQDRRAKERRRSPLRRMWIAEEDVDRRMQSRQAEERRCPLPLFSELPNATEQTPPTGNRELI